MKHLFRKLVVILTVLVSVFSMQMHPVSAIGNSANYKTGYRTGTVIRRTYGYTGSGRTRSRYMKTKDVYLSERKEYEQWAKDVTKEWVDLSSNKSLQYTQSQTVSASGSVDIVKAMGLKTSLTIGKSSSAGATFAGNPKKGRYGKLAGKCDYVIITYNHYTYNSKGRQTGCSKQTVKVPIPGSLAFYVRYSN